MVRPRLRASAPQGATLVGLIVALDREERGEGSELTAIGQVKQDLGVPVVSIVTLEQLIGFLEVRASSTRARADWLWL